VLRDQVRKSFQGMKHGFSGQHQHAATKYPATLNQVSEEMFPLFLTQGEFLKMVDGTTKEPFWARNLDGTLKHKVSSAFHEERGMLDAIPDNDDFEWSDSDDDEQWIPHQGASSNAAAAEKTRSEPGRGLEVDFIVFVDVIWPKIKKARLDLKLLSPASIFQEIHSYIKGSGDALRSEGGFLTRDEYNTLGAKMAPNFKQALVNDEAGDKSASRLVVYDVFLQYEKEKTALNGYDVSDVVFHIYRQLEQQEPQQIPRVHSTFVDETQDFTQAELALFLRLTHDKNDCVFSGDTCQTIACGVGFRFEDLKSLFKYEQNRQARENKGVSLPAALRVRVPNVKTLAVNYRYSKKKEKRKKRHNKH